MNGPALTPALWHLEMLVCPQCRGALLVASGGDAISCTACGRSFDGVRGVPNLADAGAVHDSHKHQQAEFFDSADDEWEIARPRGAPSFYAWLLAEKYRRSVAGIRNKLEGASALVVCAGSGMDAEFLAHDGARVISSDISPGAVARSVMRSTRHDVGLAPLVADIEHLPFPDRSVDWVYVHDGLHHLEDPYRGVDEMARVARCGVSITEPTDATVTRAATRVRLAKKIEEAGNPVERLDIAALRSRLEAADFRVVHSSRYAMFYRHRPGAVSRALSVLGVEWMAKLGFLGANGLIGRAGNKLTIQAIREDTR